MEIRVWERGVGETLACGTGACAAVVASVLNDLTDEEVIVKLLGGELSVRWDRKVNHVFWRDLRLKYLMVYYKDQITKETTYVQCK